MNVRLLFFSIVSLSLLTACQSYPLEEALAAGNTFDYWIRNGHVIDGSGSPGFVADVLVRADTIAYIGEIPIGSIQATDTIDASGKMVSPGFIDSHAHGDPFATPDFHNFLAMGVTTITLGQDGSSPNTKDISRWMDSLDQQGIGPNLAMFAGHGTLRKMSGTGYSESPTPQQIEDMQALLTDQLEAGCFGISTGLEYTPGLYASQAELTALAKVTGQRGAVMMSHMRNEDDDQLLNSIDELLTLGKQCRVHISHIKSVYGKGSTRADEILSWLDSARQSGTTVTADLYPYSASYTGIGIVFPTWAKAPNEYSQVLRDRREELATYLRNRISLRNGPEATLIGTGAFRGKTLAAAAAILGKPFEEVLMDDIGPRGTSGAYFVMNDALQQRIAQDSMVMICSDGSPTGFHPRGHGTFAKIIQEYIQEKYLFSLEEGIRKMTAFPAQVIGIRKRGQLRSGYYADLLIFDPEQVKATATYPEPHQLAQGFEAVMVNGQIVKAADQFPAERYGRVLRAR